MHFAWWKLPGDNSENLEREEGGKKKRKEREEKMKIIFSYTSAVMALGLFQLVQ